MGLTIQKQIIDTSSIFLGYMLDASTKRVGVCGDAGLSRAAVNRVSGRASRARSGSVRCLLAESIVRHVVYVSTKWLRGVRCLRGMRACGVGGVEGPAEALDPSAHAGLRSALPSWLRPPERCFVRLASVPWRTRSSEAGGEQGLARGELLPGGADQVGHVLADPSGACDDHVVGARGLVHHWSCHLAGGAGPGRNRVGRGAAVWEARVAEGGVRHRPGSRVVTSCSTHPLPSGSLKAVNEP